MVPFWLFHVVNLIRLKESAPVVGVFFLFLGDPWAILVGCNFRIYGATSSLFSLSQYDYFGKCERKFRGGFWGWFVPRWGRPFVVLFVCASQWLFFIVPGFAATLDRWRAILPLVARHRQGRNPAPLGGGYPSDAAIKVGVHAPREAGAPQAYAGAWDRTGEPSHGDFRAGEG